MSTSSPNASRSPVCEWLPERHLARFALGLPSGVDLEIVRGTLSAAFIGP